MDLNNFKQIVKRSLLNIPGWRTNRKIVVFESDDWGSIRMPSYDVYKKCLEAGFRVDLNPYEKYDSLESADDLNTLFDVLSGFRDVNNKTPVFTANCCVANPDFDKIRENNFTQYEYELVTSTFKKYPNHSKSFKLWKKGLSDKLFFPQFHAREHLNIYRFMKSLKNKDEDVIFGFANEMPGIIRLKNNQWVNEYVEATNYQDEKNKNYILESYLDGLKIFYELLGYNSESLIPANYTWSDDYNEAVSRNGIKYIQGVRKYKVLDTLKNKNIYKSVYLGKKNKYNQLYIVRNSSFEPTLTKNENEHLKCLSEISTVFKYKKPAIISTHRLNYIGFINIKNRNNNLKLLSELLKNIIKKWPSVEFMNSVQLGKLIEDETSNT